MAAERELSIDYTLGTDSTASGDHEALRRAAANLLSNAVRLAPAGTAVTVGAGRVDGWLWLAVRTAAGHRRRRPGPGVRPVLAAGRPAPPAKAGERRTGLGLAIVRQIVESHGGRAAVHSKVGDGSHLRALAARGGPGRRRRPAGADPVRANPFVTGLGGSAEGGRHSRGKVPASINKSMACARRVQSARRLPDGRIFGPSACGR